jgi:exodeoxyribonuclease V gamma subunit
VLWRRVDEHLGADGRVGRGAAADPREDLTREVAANPLLATWGRDAREMQLLVRRAPDAVVHDLEDPELEDHPGDRATSVTARSIRPAAPTDGRGAPSLLARLQADVRGDRPVHTAGAPDHRPLLAPDDRSVTFHRCHGRTRQVEVLRDVLLHLLADVDGLEPRDIVVMCPDIESFAPTIEAVFGAHATAAEGPDLRVQLADRSLRRTNAVLRVVAEVLDLADSRLTASAVLDLCGRSPVRRRFGFDEDDLVRLERWFEESGVRWGLDAAHRDELGVPTDANTWRAALDRLLVGVAVADEGLRTVGGVVPVDDVEGSDADLAGRLAELVARLDHIRRELAVPRPLDGWRQVLTDAADALCATDEDDAWQRIQLGRTLDEVADAATIAARPRRATAGRRSPPPRSPCPSCATSSRTGSAAGRPGRPTGPVTSPCARSSRCGRSRTGRWSSSASTTRSSPGGPWRTATTCSPSRRWSATATRGPRTASCCSTRCSPPRTGWS